MYGVDRPAKTKYSFQIIAIDDGSTDRSGQILNQYIKNPCVEVIRQENKGYSGARNTGLERVKANTLCLLIRMMFYYRMQ